MEIALIGLFLIVIIAISFFSDRVGYPEENWPDLASEK
jgi:hypothetical protein